MAGQTVSIDTDALEAENDGERIQRLERILSNVYGAAALRNLDGPDGAHFYKVEDVPTS